MKRIALVIILIVLAVTGRPAFAQQQVIPGHMSVIGCPTSQLPCWIPTMPLQPLGFQQISTLSSATKLTVPTYANVAVIRAESASVRYRDDGVSPTSSVGQLILTADQPLTYIGTLSALTFIQAASGAGLDIVYYK